MRLSISLCVSVPGTQELWSSWKQRPPARDIHPSVPLCRSQTHTDSFSTSPTTDVADNTPGSNGDHLLNDRSISLSSWFSRLPLSPCPASHPPLMLPGNQWTKACKQKSNRLHSWLLLRFGNVCSQLDGIRNKSQQPASLTSGEYFTLTQRCYFLLLSRWMNNFAIKPWYLQ